MPLSKFVHTETGRLLMSILLGFGLATFFRQVCIGENCISYNAPPVAEIDGEIYKFDDTCYKIQKNAVKCDNKKEIVAFSTRSA
jgi:hypothetical protein